MTGVTKRFFIGIAIFTVAMMVLFGTGQLKGTDSGQWGQEVTES
ncbi:hypothetical protein [Mesobacillus subterraneus]|nr:hypothetical protein [Mesobacillus subterraneus]